MATTSVQAGPLGRNPRPGQRPCVVCSGNGERSVALAYDLIAGGTDPAEAVVRGVRIVEDDPSDMTVGYGGLPNEDGVVELDASVIHGPSHKCGAVAGLRNVRHASAVALEVLRRTDHVLLVGEGALKFARAMGFKEEDLLTEEARQAWLKWKANLNADDDWLNEDQREGPAIGKPTSMRRNWLKPGDAGPWPGDLRHLPGDIPFTYGTIHCSAVNSAGDIGSTTSTSGLSYKLAGRVGDSPIIGAGNFADNDVGAAGATGRGEAVIQSCGAFAIVDEMARGAEPLDACLSVLRSIVRRTKIRRLLDERGRPNFNVTVYALRKDGAFGSASLHEGATFAVHDGQGARVEKSAFLYPADPAR